MENVIRVNMCGTHNKLTQALYQYDYGQVLLVEGISLPETYEVHFANERDGETVTVIGTSEGVQIPDTLLETGKDITAYIYLHEAETDGETEYVIRIPVHNRPRPADFEPTEEEEITIASLLAAMNSAIQHASDSAQDAAESAAAAEDAMESYEEMTAAATDLPYGSQPTSVIDRTGDHPVLRLGIPEGKQGIQGNPGNDGVSPVVEVIDISGGHRVTITDAEGEHIFYVADGQDGAPGGKGDKGGKGDPGVSPTVTVTNITGGHRIKITDAQGDHTFDVMDGVDGQDGAVLSVNTKTGHVVLDGGDINVNNSAQTPVTVADELGNLNRALNVLEPSATSADIGKTLVAKTIENGKVTEYEFGESGGSGTVDDALSTTSTNPVQNKVITSALNLRGGSGLTVIDQAEMLKKMTIVRKSENILNNKRYLETGGYYDWNTGNFVSSSNYNSYSWVPVEAETTYAPNYLGNITFWTADKQFISGVNSPSYFTTPANCAYMCGSTTNTPGNYTATLAEGQTKLQNYTEYYVVTKLDKDYYVIEFNDGAIAPESLQDIPPEKISFLIPGSANGNLFDPSKSTPNGYYNSSNIWVNNVNYLETAFIQVEPNTEYRADGFGIATGSFNAYSSDFSFIENLTYDGTYRYITTSENAAYVRFGYLKNPTNPMFGLNDKFPAEYIACVPVYNIDESVIKLPAQPHDITNDLIKVPGTINLFNPEDIRTSGYYNGSLGWVRDTGYNSTGLIPVEYGKTYKFGGSGNNFYMTVQYASDLTVLASGQPSSGTYTINQSNCKYIRVCFTGPASTVMITELADYPDEYVPYTVKYMIPNEMIGDLVTIDQTLTVEGEAADAKVVGDRLAEVNERFAFLIEDSETANMFDPSKSIVGGYYDNTNTWNVNQYYNETGFMKAEPNTEYYFSGFTPSPGSFNAYDADFQFLSNMTISNGFFTTPSTVVYIRFAYHNTLSTNCMIAPAKNFPESYVAYKSIYDIDPDIVRMPKPYDLTGDFFKTSWSVNLFDKNDVETLGYYNNTGWHTDRSYTSSGPIWVHYGKVYKVGGSGNTFGTVCQYDAEMNLLAYGQLSNGTYTISEELCCYIRICFTGSASTVIVSELDEYPTEYVAYVLKYVVPDAMVEKIQIDDSQAYVQHNRDKFKANPPYPLKWEMNYVEGEDQPTHPSVQYFVNGWNGHKWWMAYTPYPNNANVRENPCIAYSDDGYAWSEKGISNPIDIPASGYNSDCELVYDSDEDILYCYWRLVTNNTTETFYRMESEDGFEWENKTEILGGVVGVSPALVYDNGTFKLWTRDASYGMKYYESSDGVTFSYVSTINLMIGTSAPWHLDVEKTVYGYEFVGCLDDNIIHAISEDNITYTITGKILGLGYENRFDSKQLYRPTIVRKSDGVRIYYGANGLNGNSGTWGIGVVEAPSIKMLVHMMEQAGEDFGST